MYKNGGDSFKKREEKKRINNIIQKAIDGDIGAFEKIYDLYVDKIFKYIYFKVGNLADAEDLTSKVFLKAFEKIKHYEIRKSPFSSWLFRVAHNIVVDLYREKSKYPFEGQEDILLNLPEGETPETSIFLKIENENLRKALWELTGDQRDVIVFRRV